MENTYTRAWQLQKLICYRNITTIQRKYWQKNQHATETLRAIQSSLGPGLAVGGKGKKRGQIGKISASEASWVYSGEGEWAAEPGVMPLMPPFHDTRFWYLALIGQMSSCWQIRGAVDSIALFQYHAPTITEKIFLNTDFEQAIQISLRNFSLIPRLQEEQKICLWSVAKR